MTYFFCPQTQQLRQQQWSMLSPSSSCLLCALRVPSWKRQQWQLIRGWLLASGLPVTLLSLSLLSLDVRQHPTYAHSMTMSPQRILNSLTSTRSCKQACKLRQRYFIHVYTWNGKTQSISRLTNKLSATLWQIKHISWHCIAFYSFTIDNGAGHLLFITSLHMNRGILTLISLSVRVYVCARGRVGACLTAAWSGLLYSPPESVLHVH